MRTVLVLISLLFTTAVFAQSGESMSKEEQEISDACEALLCLSTNIDRPAECNPSIDKYYSIKVYHSNGDLDTLLTIAARKSFLNQCPSDGDVKMENLVVTMAATAELCESDGLNRQGRWVQYSTTYRYDKPEASSEISKQKLAELQRNDPLKYQQVMKERLKNPCVTNNNEQDEWHSKIYVDSWDMDGGTCTTYTKYWDVIDEIPIKCDEFWNHEYTEYDVIRPHLVYGSDPWDTRWVN